MKPGRKNSRNERLPKEEKNKGQEFAGPPAPRISSSRRRQFRLIALIAIPAVFLGILEILLRCSGFGYSTDFFEKIQSGGKEYLVYNENFSRRFFPPQLERSPSPIMIESQKPPNTYRVFVLGESAARGDPQMPFAASRYMEKLLDERFPKTHFEVVNLGITAINSHVILPMARDVARANGDLWIIYMGNNEMVGPFGAATVFGAKAPPLGFVRLGLAIQKTRVGQLLVELGRRIKGPPANSSWRGMSMFVGNEVSAGDQRREAVYKNFAGNLNDIVRAGLDSGAKILLNTMAVNLKDCPPFASPANTNLPPADRAQFDQLFAEGCAAEGRNDFTSALQDFARASKVDSQYPELEYRRGECLLAQSNSANARTHFQAACDIDALPFRADSRINGAIENAGRQFGGDRLKLFDAASALGREAPFGICGQETFYEHVHFNFDGNYRLGQAWAAEVERLLPVEITREGGRSWVSREVCEQRLGLTDWNRCAMTKLAVDNLHRPPLSGQTNNTQRLSSLANKIQIWRGQMTQATAQSAANTYPEALQHSPGDHFIVENFADFLESTGDLKEAEAQWEQDCELLPTDCTAYYNKGRLLSSLRQWPEAEAAVTKAIELRPRLTEAWAVLGNVHFGAGKFDAALHDYEHAAQMEPEVASYCAYIGAALSKLNRHGEAIRRYRQALQMQPDLWEVHFAVADELTDINQFDDAKNEYAEILRLKPGNALAHLNMGVMEAKLGQLDAALEQFEETLRLEPGNRTAQEYVNRLRNQKAQRH